MRCICCSPSTRHKALIWTRAQIRFSHGVDTDITLATSDMAKDGIPGHQIQKVHDVDKEARVSSEVACSDLRDNVESKVHLK
jgi:hypothetical protein